MKIMLCDKNFYESFRKIVCKRVYRSGGKSSRRRVKWVRR